MLQILKKEKQGTALIDEVIGEFQGMVDKLEKGVNQNMSKMSDNDARMHVLQAENDGLKAASEQAVNVRNKLVEIIS